MNLLNKWVLVTGASSGLGEEISIQLAERYQANLILVARREDKLHTLRNKILDLSDIEVKIICADLSIVHDIKLVINQCVETPNFYGVILNAGMTYLGLFTSQSIENQSRIINLNIQSNVVLMSEFVKYFESTQNDSRIMVVSSLAHRVPAPYQSVYSGTKAFLTNFVHSLKHELKNKKLLLSVFSPGGIKTEMTQANGFKDLESYLMPVQDAAKAAINGFIKGKHDTVPGLMNRVSIVLMAFIPTRFISKLMGAKYLKSLENNQSN